MTLIIGKSIFFGTNTYTVSLLGPRTVFLLGQPMYTRVYLFGPHEVSLLGTPTVSLLGQPMNSILI